ncbi:MAG: tRNA (adenosine(37)-N6)-threonylcarbamoyltransferase complex dimerization subunit type 1 TsaB [Chitinophagaceae bacterium]
MPLILNIDTATTYGGVGLAANGTIIALAESSSQKDHATFLQPSILQVMKDAGKSLSDIDAIAVTIGPGSYTGLRVGLASAKGLCYALGKPLLTINTLAVMALAAIEEWRSASHDVSATPIFIPMIDARRMEVFAAAYNLQCDEIMAAKALIIEENIFTLLPVADLLVFSGDGSLKLAKSAEHTNIFISSVSHTIRHLAYLALEKFKHHQFADIAYCEPFYLKPFYTTAIRIQ